MLIVISGLPATGKSTLATALAERIRATHLSVDVVEDAMLRAGSEPGWTTGVAAYLVAGATAQQNLELGHPVVVDAVNDSDAARQTWRDSASRAEVAVHFVLLHPPPVDEHQRRLRVRRRDLEHISEPSWSEVGARAETYERWTDGPIELASAEPVETLVQRLVDTLALDA